MATTGNERYLRYILLLGKGGLFVLRCLLRSEVSKGHHTLEQVLENNRNLFKRIMCKQLKKIFPTTTSVNTNIDSWDISVLCIVLTKLFKNQLNSSAKLVALNDLKTSRDENYAHPDQMEMTDNDFQVMFNDLEDCLKQLASGLGQDVEDEINRLAECSKSDPIDIHSSIQSLKDLKEFEVETLDNIERKLSCIEDRLVQHGKLQEENRNRLTDISTIQDHMHQDILDTKKGVQELTNNLKELFTTRMNVNTNTEENQKKASLIIYEHVQKIQNEGRVAEEEIKEKIDKIVGLDPNLNTKLLQALFELFDEINKNPDVEIGQVSQGSVLISFKCSSMRGLLRHMIFMESEQCKQRLSEISSAVNDVLGVSCSIIWTIESDSLLSFLESKLECTDKQKRDFNQSKLVVLPIRYTSLNGLAHVWDMLEKGTIYKHMQKISTILSEDVGDEITVSFSVDMEQFVNAVYKARPTAIGGTVLSESYVPGFASMATYKQLSNLVDFTSNDTNDKMLAMAITTATNAYFALMKLSNVYELTYMLTITNLMAKMMQKLLMPLLYVNSITLMIMRNSMIVISCVTSVEAQGYFRTSNKDGEEIEQVSSAEESETDEDEESDSDDYY